MLRTVFPAALAAFLILTAILSPDPAHAADPERIGGQGKWDAYTYKSDAGTVCYMASTPDKQEGKYTKRDDPFALVTNSPATGSRGEVSFIAGYSFKKDGTVKVSINKKSFTLFTESDRAWPTGREIDAEMVEAMVNGSRMVVNGVSSRGTKTRDTYSLSGFTATKKIIDTACPK